MDNQNKIIIYQTTDNTPKIEVRLEDETVWLSQQQLSELYQSSRTNVVEHIKHIYQDGELNEMATCRKFRQVQKEGNRDVTREIPFYNLDMVISLGYRINSKTATTFRIWATEHLKEFIKKGFVLDNERLKNLGSGGYFKELLQRIRDIRASEKVFYRQILDIYATSIDYDPKAEVSQDFFRKVQNKIHYAIHGQTAAEVVFSRADAEKEFMGLMTFSGSHPQLQEAVIAKNYLIKKSFGHLGKSSPVIWILPNDKPSANRQ